MLMESRLVGERVVHSRLDVPGSEMRVSAARRCRPRRAPCERAPAAETAQRPRDPPAGGLRGKPSNQVTINANIDLFDFLVL